MNIVVKGFDDDTWTRMRVLAAKKKMPVKTLLDVAVKQYLKQEEDVDAMIAGETGRASTTTVR